VRPQREPHGEPLRGMIERQRKLGARDLVSGLLNADRADRRLDPNPERSERGQTDRGKAERTAGAGAAIECGWRKRLGVEPSLPA